jgi:hypothetical protein
MVPKIFWVPCKGDKGLAKILVGLQNGEILEAVEWPVRGAWGISPFRNPQDAIDLNPDG